MPTRMGIVGLACASLVAAAGCGGSDSTEASLEVTVTPALYECRPNPTGVTARECRPVAGVASLRCSPDELSYALPEGIRPRAVDAGDVCGRVTDEELLSPADDMTCARPRGRVGVVGEVDGEPVRLALRSCAEVGDDEQPEADDPASAWARLVGLPFAPVPQ